MTHNLDYIRKKLGWCPNARTMRTAPGMFEALPSTLQTMEPGGGAGGPGRIDRGIHLASGSILILVRNKRLLWFSLLTGLVMIFSVAASLYLQFTAGTDPFPGTALFPEPSAVLIAKGSVLWTALTFIVALVATFLANYLLAGLIACVSVLISGSTATIREGLSRAGDHAKTLAIWAIIGAAAGTAISLLSTGYTADFSFSLLSMIPFMVFFILMLFVIPAIVLDNADLVSAIRGSVSMFRRIWAEIFVCFAVFLLIVFLISISSLIPLIMVGFSSGNPGMAGAVVILYMLVLAGVMIVGSTVVGIATFGLYSFARNGKVPRPFDGKRGVWIPA